MSRTKKEIRVGLRDKFYVINETSESQSFVPLDCPVCGFALRDRKDVLSYKAWQCCSECETSYVHQNSEKWSMGWRPKV